MTKGTIDTTNKLIKPEDISPSDDAIIRQLSENLQDISPEDVDAMCDEMKETKKLCEPLGDFEYSGGKEKLIGDTYAILNDLRENHVKIEENAEVEGYKGKKVHIDLPAVGNFEGFKFDYFVSNDYIYKKDFEAKSELKKKSYSMSDVSKLLQAMNEYMTELGGENDGNIDYETELKYWETKKYRCTAGDCLKTITGLKYWYWLSDKDVAGRMDSRAFWNCRIDACYFSRYASDSSLANLFLRLSD